MTRRRLAWAALACGLLSGGGVGVLLSVTGALAWPDAALCAVVMALMPCLALAQVPIAEVDALERIPAYGTSALTIAAIAAVCWAVGTRSLGPRALGFVALPVRAFVLWTLLLAAIGLAVLGACRMLSALTGWRESRLLLALLPRTGAERAAFAILSLVAGFGEEIVYRGYVIPELAGVLGAAGAAVLTSAVFGVLHAYQGALGVVRASLLGGALAWGFLATGSLWPPIAAHAIIDVVAGSLLPERLAGR